VSRSSTICEIATFITLESSTMTNWADARMSMGSHLRTVRPTLQPEGIGLPRAWSPWTADLPCETIGGHAGCGPTVRSGLA
jgi:hypothetical protein